MLWEVTRVEELTLGSLALGGFVVSLNCTLESDATSVVHVIVAVVFVVLAPTPEIWGGAVVVAAAALVRDEAVEMKSAADSRRSSLLMFVLLRVWGLAVFYAGAGCALLCGQPRALSGIDGGQNLHGRRSHGVGGIGVRPADDAAAIDEKESRNGDDVVSPA